MPGERTGQGGRKSRVDVWQLTDASPQPMDLGRSIWLGEGSLSKYTPAVAEFSAKFDLKTLDGISALCKAVHSFRRTPKGFDDLVASYAKRTADEIIASKTIHVKSQGIKDFPLSFPQVDGCVDFSLAIAAALRCGGVPALFVREGIHSNVLFKHGGETYLADIFSPQEMIRFKSTDSKMISGLDPADIGMRSIEDYWIAAGQQGTRRKNKLHTDLTKWRLQEEK
jgi:hypothetical protein